MRLEEAIKQKAPFRSPWHKLTVNLLFTNNWLMGLQKDLFKPYNITTQQYNVLRILRGAYPEPISTSDIRDRMLDKMSDVSRIVDRMVKKGLVSRRTCKTDKRLVDVLITEDGLDLLKKMDETTASFDTSLASLSAEEAIQLNELLDKLRGTYVPEECK
ncbi:MAG: MarR family transcriptional regulator [Bacteroidia bacterium]|nr:MarR family transcriptional regulator [Bacteroidia bacterium]